MWEGARDPLLSAARGCTMKVAARRLRALADRLPLPQMKRQGGVRASVRDAERRGPQGARQTAGAQPQYHRLAQREDIPPRGRGPRLHGNKKVKERGSTLSRTALGLSSVWRCILPTFTTASAPSSTGCAGLPTPHEEGRPRRQGSAARCLRAALLQGRDFVPAGRSGS